MISVLKRRHSVPKYKNKGYNSVTYSRIDVLLSELELAHVINVLTLMLTSVCDVLRLTFRI